MEISSEVSRADKAAFARILESSGFFYDFEVEVVMSLLEETVEHGEEKSGYYWLRYIENGKVIAFATYGPNSCTIDSWDLYWIAVSEEYRNKHIGSLILNDVEKRAKDKGCRILWIETAGRSLYEPTRYFYIKNGYELAGTLKEYYGPGDDKLVYRKEL